MPRSAQNHDTARAALLVACTDILAGTSTEGARLAVQRVVDNPTPEALSQWMVLEAGLPLRVSTCFADVVGDPTARQEDIQKQTRDMVSLLRALRGNSSDATAASH